MRTQADEEAQAEYEAEIRADERKKMNESKIELRRDADFQKAFAKFMADLRAGDTTSEVHGFCSGWIAHRDNRYSGCASLREALEEVATWWRLSQDNPVLPFPNITVLSALSGARREKGATHDK